MTHQKGFTLIELMVTVAILAIIASIAIPAYNGYIRTARNTEAAQDLASLRIAQEEFFAENNTYFLGADAGAIRTASGLIWQPGNWDILLGDAANNAALDFSFAVVAGNTLDIATSYSATATGQNNVSAVVVVTVTN